MIQRSELFIIFFSIYLAYTPNIFADFTSNTKERVINETERHEAVFSLSSKAYEHMLRGDNRGAEALYLEALSVASGSVLEKVVRGELARLYERSGEYQKALEQVEWWISFFDAQNTPHISKNRIRYTEMKQRLLQEKERKGTVPKRGTR
jgi:hypothetical protein